ncbi:MAG: tyrosine-type recombinase/integrase [Ruminococcus sp.]|nr:tyrosine-type recombinase/integrase [Ruminococcus sp.]
MRSKRILLYDENKIKLINPETIKIFEKYQVDMMMRNLSENTIYHYKLDLIQWFIYVLDKQDNKSVVELTDDDISEFLYFCMKEGNHSERIKRRTAAISTLYRYMRKKHIIRENPVEFIDRPKKGLPITAQTYLTPEQVAMMREALIRCNDIQLRTYAMLSLSTMARASAVASIKWNQIDLEAKIIKGVLEKEGKIVDLYFSDEVKYLMLQLKSQRESRNRNDYGYLFSSGRNKNKPIARGTLNAWSKRIGEMIGVPTLHPHDFRHSGATLLKNAGMSLEDVSVLLSHESTDTTKKYYIKQDTAKIGTAKAMFNI